MPNLPPNVAVAYKWHYGTNFSTSVPLSKIWLFDFWVFVPFEHAVELYSSNVNQFKKFDIY